MTAHYIHAMLYNCDECGVSVEGTDARLPLDWKLINIDEPDNWNAKVGHVCPKCAPPEPKAP